MKLSRIHLRELSLKLEALEENHIDGVESIIYMNMVFTLQQINNVYYITKINYPEKP